MTEQSGHNPVQLSKMLELLPGVVILSSIIMTWALLNYRMDAAEARIKELEQEQREAEKKNNEQVAEVKCLICNAHDIRCPGC